MAFSKIKMSKRSGPVGFGQPRRTRRLPKIARARESGSLPKQSIDARKRKR